MPGQWILLFCVAHTARPISASLLQRVHGRGTVAERRSQQWPEMSTRNAPLQSGLDASSPESFENVQNYAIAMPTPVPAAFNGMYCKGGACQYRVPQLPPTYPPPITPPPLPIGGNRLSGREFCRGLGCISGMGMPGDANLQAFNLNCVHLFQDIGGGMMGSDVDRSVAQVHASFTNVCKKRVGILEVGACPAYANTFLAAESPKVDNPSVGGPIEVCTDAYWWILGFKQAEIDLKLTAAALPKARSSSLLAGGWARLGSGGVGPSSPRGLKWRAYAWNHGIKPSPPADAQQLASDGSIAAALLQTDLEDPIEDPALLQTDLDAPKPLLPGADSAEDTPRGLPKYTQNIPCNKNKNHIVPQSGTKYQIAPGSPDGAVPPIEVDGDLFTYCSNQFSEIMMGFAQTALETIKMTKGWCAWQASISSWVGQQEEFGHPDWSQRTCSGMGGLVAFALRDHLDDTTTGFSAQQVCKNVFLSIGAVHRTDSLVKGAWETSLRGAPSSGIPSKSNEEMARMLQEAQAYANKIFGKLRKQKAAFETLNGKKMEMGSFDTSNIPIQPPPPVAPDLPDSDDVDLTALLSLSVERVRQHQRIRIGPIERLKRFGA